MSARAFPVNIDASGRNCMSAYCRKGNIARAGQAAGSAEMSCVHACSERELSPQFGKSHRHNQTNPQQEDDMNRNAIALALGLLVGPALAPGAIAQGAPPPITTPEAHALCVD